MNALLDMLVVLARHADVIVLVIDAIESRQVPRDRLVKTIEDLITEASDAEMRRELKVT